jgi:hypothetical protein
MRGTPYVRLHSRARRKPWAPLTHTPLTPRRRVVLAALLGTHNAGQPLPSRQEVERVFALGRSLTVDSCARCLVRGVCEDDTMLEMFQQEAQSWYDGTLRDYTEEHVARVWPDVALLVQGLA